MTEPRWRYGWQGKKAHALRDAAGKVAVCGRTTGDRWRGDNSDFERRKVQVLPKCQLCLAMLDHVVEPRPLQPEYKELLSRMDRVLKIVGQVERLPDAGTHAKCNHPDCIAVRVERAILGRL